MLGEVTDADPGAHLQLARQRRIAARQHLDKGGLAGAVAPQEADARPRHQVWLIFQNHLVAVTGAEVLHGDKGRRRAEGSRNSKLNRVGVGGQDLLHPLHGLEAALGLPGLEACSGSGHIGLHVGHLPLLLLIHGLLLGELFGALQLEVGVAAAVFVELAVLDVDDAVHHGVEEVPVVGDQHQRALVALEPLLQPDDGVQIQVVGRFIQQQQIGATQQRLGQVQAHAPAAGETSHRRVELIAAKAQAVQQLGGARANAVGAYGVEPAVQLGHQQTVVILLGFGQFGLQGAEPLSPSITYSRAEHSSAGVSWATPAICQPAGRLKLPLSMASSPRTSAKKVDLPQPFFHQTHLVAGMYGGGRVVQQRAAAADQFDLTGNYHGWVCLARVKEENWRGSYVKMTQICT